MSLLELPQERRITVFGSSTSRVEPNVVSLQFDVSRHSKLAKDALEEAQKASGNVQKYLSDAQIRSVGVSQVNLGNYYDRGVPDGYQAQFSFHVILQDLSRLQQILLGAIDAGANLIQSVDFQTTDLKSIRAKARQQAIEAAKEKALIYCQAANVELGDVLRIDDQNPDRLQNRRYSGHMSAHTEVDPIPVGEDEEMYAVNPASIIVAATVTVTFEIKPHN